MLDRFEKKSLHLAELKYFDMQHNGVEVSEPASYVVLCEYDEGKFFNVLDPIEMLPTFERVPGTTNVYDNKEYLGNKLNLLTDECSTGPCWLLCDKGFRDSFEGDEVTIRQIEDYVLGSPLYFKDRLGIAKDRLRNFEKPFRMARVVREDKAKEGSVDEFFRIRCNDRKREYVKTNKDW